MRWWSAPKCIRASSTGRTAATCVLFGDGAGAVVLARSDTPGILASRLHADGRYADILSVPGSVDRAARCAAGRSCRWKATRSSSSRSRCWVKSRRRRSTAARHHESRARLADPAPGEYPHHPGDREEARHEHGTRRHDRRSAREHLRGFGAARARRSRSRRPYPRRATMCCWKAWAAASRGARFSCAGSGSRMKNSRSFFRGKARRRSA